MANPSRICTHGISLFVIGLVLFIFSLGIMKLLYPFDIETNKNIVLFAGILICIGFILISVSLIIFPKFLFVPYALLLLALTSYGIIHNPGLKALNMTPPPEWITVQYGWPMASREVVTHNLGRVVVEKSDHFLWGNSIINFCLFSLLGILIFSFKAYYKKMKS